MSVTERWAKTEEQIMLLQTAKARGGLCGWCGRDLAEDETVYIERFLVGTRQPHRRSGAQYWSTAYAPVGTECASPEPIEQPGGQAPDPCIFCGRGVIYRQARSNRRRAICSRRCASLAMLRQKAEAARG